MKYIMYRDGKQDNHTIKQAVRVATQYAPASLLPQWAPQRLARRRADAT